MDLEKSDGDWLLVSKISQEDDDSGFINYSNNTNNTITSQIKNGLINIKGFINLAWDVTSQEALKATDSLYQYLEEYQNASSKNSVPENCKDIIFKDPQGKIIRMEPNPNYKEKSSPEEEYFIEMVSIDNKVENVDISCNKLTKDSESLLTLSTILETSEDTILSSSSLSSP